MNVAYSTRGMDLTEQIKKYTEEKLRKIESLDELLEINVNLEHARHRFKAELFVHNRNARFNAMEETSDLFSSINAVIDKMQNQLKRHKGKLIGRKRKAAPKATVAAAAAVAEVAPAPRVIRSRKQDIKPMSQEEAVLQLDSRKEAFLIYRDTTSDRISVLFKRKDGNYGLIDSEI